jgi:poly(beta-D-mannuronate) lyase
MSALTNCLIATAWTAYASCAAMGDTGGAGMKAPFGPGSGVVIGSTPSTPCPAPIPPVRDVLGTAYYTDVKHSIIDPAKRAQDSDAAAPLRRFEQIVLEQGDQYLASNGTDKRSSDCVLSQLDSWAGANALMGHFWATGEGHRMWAVVGLSIAFLSVRDAPAQNQAAVQRVSRWLSVLGHAIQKRCEAGVRNNVYDWAAAAAVASGVAAQDRELFDWGIEAGRNGTLEVSPDGSLPLELSRGQRALSYHSFALTALMLVAEFGRANGADIYSLNDHALDRLANFILVSMQDESAIAQLSGVQQLPETVKNPGLFWLEAYYARTGDKRVIPYLAKRRPITYLHFGNTTLLFGRPFPNSTE